MTYAIGNVLDVLPTLDADRFQCCVTSPPYWGLRDYGHADQLGLEPTPDAYVANMVRVFREVRRVLRPDGVLWLNLGDTYASGEIGRHDGYNPTGESRKDFGERRRMRVDSGTKPKDLVGIPWALARALRDPYYTGRVARERDRVWMAAMIDGEGTICGFDHTRADDGSHRSGVHVTITNTSTLLLDEAERIWPASRSEHQKSGDGHLGQRDSWRWIVHGIENKIAFLREVYPYLVVKRRQAVAAYSMLLLMADAKRLGHSPQRDETIAKRRVLTQLMSDLNQGNPVVEPDWLTEPPTLYEPGWYLRSDTIWAKPNPMPESVTDRPTKAHEYVFLLSKSERYVYDAEAVAEEATNRAPGNKTHKGAAAYDDGDEHHRTKGGLLAVGARETRNTRTVWTIASQPFAGAHFATMPPKLAERCILAGSRIGDEVLDPFLGSGTVGMVAESLGRRWFGVELNPAYEPLIKQRTAQQGLFGRSVA